MICFVKAKGILYMSSPQQRADYQALYENCLAICDFNRKRAAEMFAAEFPSHYHIMRRYSYTLYQNYCKKRSVAEEKSLMEIRKIHEMMALSAHAADNNDVEAFVDLTKMQLPMLGYGNKSNMPLTQVNVTQPTGLKELLDEIRSLSDDLKLPVPATIGCLAEISESAIDAEGTGAAGSVHPLPPQSEAGDSVQQQQQADMGVWGQPGG